MSRKFKQESIKQAVQNPLINPKIYFLLIFIEGFLIMGIELTGTSLIAPHFGTSLTIWTFVIGITMIALTTGYFFGGHLSRQGNLDFKIYLLLFLAAATILLMPFSSAFFFRAFLSYGLVTTLVICVFPFLFPPLFLLGSLSPILVKKISLLGNTAGSSSGKVFALSTIAGVLSAVSIAFFLIELFQTYHIIYFYAAVCFAILIVFSFKVVKGTKKFFPASGLVLFSIAFFNSAAHKLEEPYPRNYKEIYKTDGIFGQLKIVDNYNENSRSLFVNNTIQTICRIQGESAWEYVHKINAFIAVQNKTSKILMAGLGGGNLAYGLGINGHEIDIVEIDKRMPNLAKKYFNLEGIHNLNFIINDIRHFVNATSNKYDFIILDLSAGENAPSHVYTLESFREMKKMLNEGGIIFIHYFSSHDVPDDLLSTQSIGKTLLATQMEVKLVQTKKNNEVASIIFVAGATLLGKDELHPDLKLIDFSFEEGLLLTDDKPVLDVLRKGTVLKQRKEYLDNYHEIWKILREYYSDKR